VLVLNRRSGESIVIEGDVHLDVVAIMGRNAWLSIVAPGLDTPVHFCATTAGDDVVRIEIARPVSFAFDLDGPHVEVAEAGQPADVMNSVVGLDLRVGEFVAVGDGLRLGAGSTTKGNATVVLCGPRIGAAFRVTLIRLMGSHVRLGIDAPDRRVFRKELWEGVVEANQAAADTGCRFPAGG
jgi:sRNA-binding carbon storage regulator CsrA